MVTHVITATETKKLRRTLSYDKNQNESDTTAADDTQVSFFVCGRIQSPQPPAFFLFFQKCPRPLYTDGRLVK